MPQLPFDIPESLLSYAEHFDKEPIKAIRRLKKQLKKRGPDAVGHFLLAWLYHLKGLDEEAVEEALKAKIFAPGSPFFEKLHYYLSHPHTFEAWTPDRSVAIDHRKGSKLEHEPVLDLDSLIQKLSEVESKRIKPDISETETGPIPDERSDEVDNIVSETLAFIHEKQGKLDEAINTYSRLKNIHKDKREHYSRQIERLKKEKKKRDQEKENKE